MNRNVAGKLLIIGGAIILCLGLALLFGREEQKGEGDTRPIIQTTRGIYLAGIGGIVFCLGGFLATRKNISN